MKIEISELLMNLRNKGVKCEYITPDWSDAFIKVTSCGLYGKDSVADYIRKMGYNCDID